MIGGGMIKLSSGACQTMTGPRSTGTHECGDRRVQARYDGRDRARAGSIPARRGPGHVIKAIRIGLCTNKPARATSGCSRRSPGGIIPAASAAATAWH